MKARSNSETSVKQEFLKRWIKGLKICRNGKGRCRNILERKNAIKLSADVAIASTRKGTTKWSRALMSDVVSRDKGANRILVQQILGHKAAACSNRNAHRKASRVVPSNRTRVLQRLVPGGEQMDGVSLIEETLDYILSLRVQVDVMRRLAATVSHSLETSKKHIDL